MSRCRWCSVVLLGASWVGVLGCDSSDPQPTAMERSEQALRDPMNYRADFKGSRVSSGGLSSFDKEGFKRDVNRVFNP